MRARITTISISTILLFAGSCLVGLGTLLVESKASAESRTMIAANDLSRPNDRVEEDTSKKSATRKPATKQVDKSAAEAAHQLVDDHLPQLKPLLENLRDKNDRAYRRAVGDLARSAKKLARYKERDPDLFKIELTMLQLKTQADLLTSKLKIRESEADRAELRSVSEQLTDARIQRLEHQRGLLKKRLKVAQEQLRSTNSEIESVKNSKSSSVTKIYQQFLRQAGRKEKREP